MPEPTPEVWAQIRHDYEHTGKPLAHICAEHDVTIPTVRYRMKRWQWRRRKPLIPRQGPPPSAAMPLQTAAACAQPSPTPTLPLSGGGSGPTPAPPGAGEKTVAIVPQLQSAAARLMPAIELSIARLASGALNSHEVETTGRALGTLMRTLRELNALLVQHKAPLQPDDDPVPENIDDFRYELARRIRGFIEARKKERDAQPGPAAGPEPQEVRQEGCPPGAAVDGPDRA
jgi:hypothetical protein